MKNILRIALPTALLTSLVWVCCLWTKHVVPEFILDFWNWFFGSCPVSLWNPKTLQEEPDTMHIHWLIIVPVTLAIPIFTEFFKWLYGPDKPKDE